MTTTPTHAKVPTRAHTRPQIREGASTAGRHLVVCEFAKLRHLRIGLVAALMAVGMAAMALLSTVTSAEFADPAARNWNVPLAGLSRAVPMLFPLLLAVMASRMVDVEHQGNGWLLNQTSGTTPGALCRVKLIAGGAIVATATVTGNLSVLALGRLLGIDSEIPIGMWAGFTLATTVINLVVLATHLILSAKIENQLVALGVGVLGTVVAVFAAGLPSWFAHATPWGYYSLVATAGYEAGELTTLTPSYLSVVGLAVVASALFLIITRRFDRQEA